MRRRSGTARPAGRKPMVADPPESTGNLVGGMIAHDAGQA
jgi:hypothetical protein